MIEVEFTYEQLTEIYFALGQRVNQLIESKTNDDRSAQFNRLIDRQLERTNDALAIVEKIIAN
jgi:hypothetical protein